MDAEELDPEIVAEVLRAQLIRKGTEAFVADVHAQLAAFRNANGRASSDLETIQLVAGALARLKLGLRFSTGISEEDAVGVAKAGYVMALRLVQSALGSDPKPPRRTVVDMLELFRKHAEERIWLELDHMRHGTPKPLDASTWSAERSLAQMPVIARALSEAT